MMMNLKTCSKLLLAFVSCWWWRIYFWNSCLNWAWWFCWFSSFLWVFVNDERSETILFFFTSEPLPLLCYVDDEWWSLASENWLMLMDTNWNLALLLLKTLWMLMLNMFLEFFWNSSFLFDMLMMITYETILFWFLLMDTTWNLFACFGETWWFCYRLRVSI